MHLKKNWYFFVTSTCRTWGIGVQPNRVNEKDLKFCQFGCKYNILTPEVIPLTQSSRTDQKSPGRFYRSINDRYAISLLVNPSTRSGLGRRRKDTVQGRWAPQDDDLVHWSGRSQESDQVLPWRYILVTWQGDTLALPQRTAAFEPHNHALSHPDHKNVQANMTRGDAGAAWLQLCKAGEPWLWMQTGSSTRYHNAQKILSPMLRTTAKLSQKKILSNGLSNDHFSLH